MTFCNLIMCASYIDLHQAIALTMMYCSLRIYMTKEMKSASQFCIFYFYRGIFQQRLLGSLQSPSRYNIPRIVFSIMILLIKYCWSQGSCLTKSWRRWTWIHAFVKFTDSITTWLILIFGVSISLIKTDKSNCCY